MDKNFISNLQFIKLAFFQPIFLHFLQCLLLNMWAFVNTRTGLVSVFMSVSEFSVISVFQVCPVFKMFLPKCSGMGICVYLLTDI